MQRGLGLERNDGVLQRFIREATHTRQHKKQNKIVVDVFRILSRSPGEATNVVWRSGAKGSREKRRSAKGECVSTKRHKVTRAAATSLSLKRRKDAKHQK